MAKRARIALSYYYNENWIGGTYYIENLVHALNTLPDEVKPIICVVTENRKSFEIFRKNTCYPYIQFRLATGEKHILFQLMNRVSNRLIKQNIFSKKIEGIAAAFPYAECDQFSLALNKIFWIPDFQENFSPTLFSEGEIVQRKTVQAAIAESPLQLVLSSNDACSHFYQLYPRHKVKVSVLPFAVTHPSYQHIAIGSLLAKYQLPRKYFICPNQFWKHKNHLLVLQAVKELREKNIQVMIVFTGKPNDRRNPEYYHELEAYVKAHQIEAMVQFLGFIDRSDQLQLMNHAVAVIQPSLFEGWSTVVEDTKAMNKFLVVSDIKVHREQLEDSTALFFDPYSATALAEALGKIHSAENLPGLWPQNNYGASIQHFGRQFLKISVS